MIFDPDAPVDEGVYQIVPLHPAVEKKRQIEMKQAYKVAFLCVKLSLSGRMGIENRTLYPYSWPLLSLKLLMTQPFDDSVPHHVLDDDELLWLLGDTSWFSTALRSDGIHKGVCRAYRVVHPKGRQVTLDDIKTCFPASFQYLDKKDFNPITRWNSYSYDIVESDFGLCSFLQKQNVIIQGMHRWEAFWLA